MNNIILINCDDLGYGDLGCYGAQMNQTPALDRMAEEGMLCTDFYAASPVCSPSRGAMMTGCYPPRIGFTVFGPEQAGVLRPGHGDGLNPSEITIASLLKQAGYCTALIGKWHCGDQPEFLPLQHGFDVYYGLPFSNDMGRQARDGATDRPPLPLMDGNEVVEQQPDQASLTSRYVERCIRFIRDNRDGPFFLYFAQMHTHLPLYAPEEFYKHSENGDYGACVAEVDWSVRRILFELKELGIERDTLVIFTSDNGSRADHGASNAPLRGSKAGTYEGGQRVPCLLYQPGTIPAGSRYSGILSNLDFYAGLAALAGVPLPKDRILDSVDCSELLRGETELKNPRETFFYYWKDQLEAVRHQNWKLHVSKAGEEVLELYDLAEDVGETQNVCSKHPDVVRKLESLLEKQRKDTGDGRLKIVGSGVRPIGKTEHPKRLTQYDPEHPYIVALYDKDDRG